MLITWLKSGSTPAVLWLIWVLVMRRAQRTGAKRLTFFKSTTQGIATYQKFTPAPASVHCKRWPQTYYSCQQKTLRVLNTFSRKSLFPFFYFLQKPYFFSSPRQVWGFWFMELTEKMSWGGNAKGSGNCPHPKMYGSGAWDSAAPSSITADQCCAFMKAKTDKWKKMAVKLWGKKKMDLGLFFSFLFFVIHLSFAPFSVTNFRCLMVHAEGGWTRPWSTMMLAERALVVGTP